MLKEDKKMINIFMWISVFCFFAFVIETSNSSCLFDKMQKQIDALKYSALNSSDVQGIVTYEISENVQPSSLIGQSTEIPRERCTGGCRPNLALKHQSSANKWQSRGGLGL